MLNTFLILPHLSLIRVWYKHLTGFNYELVDVMAEMENWDLIEYSMNVCEPNTNNNNNQFNPDLYLTNFVRN